MADGKTDKDTNRLGDAFERLGKLRTAFGLAAAAIHARQKRLLDAVIARIDKEKANNITAKLKGGGVKDGA